MAIVLVLRHMGKGPHPSGSPQSIHGKGGLAVHEDKAEYGPGPAGEKLSASFKASKKTTVGLVAGEVLEAIDKVHGLNRVMEQPIPIKSSTAKGRNGQFRYNSRGEAMDISISTYPTKLLTVAHEIGHFIDQQMVEGPKKAHGAWGMGGEELPSDGSPLLKEWREAVKNSDSAAQLRKMRTTGIDPFSGEKIYDWRYLLNLCSYGEMFARSYSQYITTGSGNANMMDELDTKRGMKYYDRYKYLTDEDFEPIATAFDNLFKKLGWTK